MQETLPIGEVCRQANCTPRTVRHYENEKIITPVDLTSGGHKRYDTETIAVIGTVQLLKRLGYSLKDIRKIIGLTRSRNTRQRRLTIRLRSMLSECLAGIDSELVLLAASREKIAGLIENTEKCESCTAEDCNECSKLKNLRTLGFLKV